MENQFIIKSIDNTLVPSKAALDFKFKKICATHNGRWLYVFGEALELPSNTDRTYYGSYEDKDNWIVAKGIKTIIDYLDNLDKTK